MDEAFETRGLYCDFSKNHVLGLATMRWSSLRWLLLCHCPTPESKPRNSYKELGFQNRFYLDATPGCLGPSRSLSSDECSSCSEENFRDEIDSEDDNMVRQELVDDHIEVRVARCTTPKHKLHAKENFALKAHWLCFPRSIVFVSVSLIVESDAFFFLL